MAELLPGSFPRRPRLSAIVPTAVLLLTCLAAAAAAAAGDGPGGLLRSRCPAPKLGRQKLSHFRVYWHDIVSGRSPTAVKVAEAPSSNASATAFGTIIMIDDPLTEGPAIGSKLVGRAQGMYASASQKDLGLLMTMNFALTEGEYNGSTIAILGRNQVFTEVREMPVIGGSGMFRFATGYCRARTRKLDLKTGDAVVEYNLFVMHY